jgi:hypothetical protein
MQKVLLELGPARTSNTLTVPAQEHFYVRRTAQPSNPYEKTGLKFHLARRRQVVSFMMRS